MRAPFFGALVLAAIAVTSASTRAAHAETPPNAWDAAKTPGMREAWVLHVRVERMLNRSHNDDEVVADPRLDAELRLEAARSMLEEADAAHSADVRLRYDLGLVYYELGERQGRTDLYQKAVDLMAPAVDAHPDDPATTVALSSLVYAYAKLNRPKEELATWRRYIPRLVDDSSRVVAMMNMGEAEMRLGYVDDALGTFREVMRICGTLPNTTGVGSTYVLALWDLAVALDRSGDPRQALTSASGAARIAVIGSTGRVMTGGELIAHDPGVFFVPDWERQWYLALLATAEAREAKDARDAAGYWAEAERSWTTYVEKCAADGTQDTFLRIARVRLAQAQKNRRIAAAAVAKLPARRLLPRIVP
ncbi:MAG TPA: tetratricopeptide repeat protein [Polyangiaceae bacterium]|jgi:tetratricopeptide (TPR) repeat protein